MRLAITGFGVVGALGVGRAAWWRALANPEQARAMAFSRPSTVLAALQPPAGTVAEAGDFDAATHLGSSGLRNLDRLTTFLVTAARFALRDGGLKSETGEWQGIAAERVGLCVSTAYGSLDAITEQNRIAEFESPRYINPSRFPNTVINSAAGYVGIWEDLRGPNTTLVDGNCGALDAVQLAATHLRMRRADVFLVGGGESLSEPLYVALQKLGLVGGDEPLSIGEGAALCCVETVEHARARRAPLWAEIIGYGTAFAAPASAARLVYADAATVERAVGGALADAELPATQIDGIVSSHGHFPAIAAAERAGLQAVFDGRPAYRTTATQIGETFGAGGAFAMLLASAALHDGTTACWQHVLILSVGTYGNVSALVLRRAAMSDLA